MKPLQLIKFSFVFVCLLVYSLAAAIIQILYFWTNPYTRINVINRLTFILMHVFKMLGGFKVNVIGDRSILKRRGIFVISTHVGYIDGLILGTLVPASYTTKSEIKKTPFLGMAVSMGESIFIDRSKKSQVFQYINEVAERLKNGINVINFPEGHASNGTHILPFFKAFFDAPLRVKAPIVPITLDYKKVDGKSDFDKNIVICADGKTSIIKHLWNLLGHKSVDIDVTIHNIVQPNGHLPNARGRKDMSDICMQRLAAYKNLPIADVNPLTLRQDTILPAKILSKR